MFGINNDVEYLLLVSDIRSYLAIIYWEFKRLDYNINTSYCSFPSCFISLGKDFKVKKIKLQTVRQFYMEDIILTETVLNPGDHDLCRKLEAYCVEKVEALIEKAGLPN